MKILYGPPGTGKTFRAAREAVRVIEPDVLDKDVEDRHRELVKEARIIWVTFHPSYSYEDFVEGYRPRKDEQGLLRYEVADGPFKEACLLAQPRRRFVVGETIGKGSGTYKIIAVEPGGVAVQRQNLRSNTSTLETVGFADYWTIERAKNAGLEPGDFSLQSTKKEDEDPGDRSDGAQLAMEGAGEAEKTSKERKAEASQKSGLPLIYFGNTGFYGAVWRELNAGPATAVPIVLVIDEINRADLSRVFGELMTLLEPDKRLGQREERRIRLPYSGETFGVPPEVSVIGTMNTADRSLAVLDIALRRRFEFEEVAPDPNLCPPDYGGVDVRALLRAINMRVEALRSRDNRIGHSDLMLGALERVRNEQGWPDDVGHRLRTLALVIRRRAVPLLLEYFAEDWRKAEVVLGRVGLLEAVSYEHVAKLADDYLDVDLEEHTGFELRTSWDPLSADWDEADTTARLIAVSRTA